MRKNVLIIGVAASPGCRPHNAPEQRRARRINIAFAQHPNATHPRLHRAKRTPLKQPGGLAGHALRPPLGHRGHQGADSGDQVRNRHQCRPTIVSQHVGDARLHRHGAAYIDTAIMRAGKICEAPALVTAITNEATRPNLRLKRASPFILGAGFDSGRPVNALCGRWPRTTILTKSPIVDMRRHQIAQPRQVFRHQFRPGIQFSRVHRRGLFVPVRANGRPTRCF